MAMALAACDAPGTEGDAVPETAAPTQSLDLLDSAWQLVNIQGFNNTLYTPEDPSQYTVRFRTENRLIVQSDCNRAGATWIQEGTSLVFEQFSATQAMCPFGTLHNRFVSSLMGVSGFSTRDGNLLLESGGGSTILEFEPLVFSVN